MPSQEKTTQERLEEILAKIIEEDEKGSGKGDSLEKDARKLQKQLREEAKKAPPRHPALEFGPISQTVSIMAVISLALSVSPLPYQMLDFYYLFSRITIVAVISLVSYTTIIYYGYTQALEKTKKPPEDPERKLDKLRSKMFPDRPDAWAHTRSHPSAFLTTRFAPPRLFPFPLGKSRPEASVKDELWWEGGNAPHVGHFNKPKLAKPAGPDPKVWMMKVEKKMQIERVQNMWKKRVRNIQTLCILIIIGVVNRKIAAVGLAWLVYSTLSNEIENMLAPPPDMDAVEEMIGQLAAGGGRVESAPKPANKTLTGGMSYIYDPSSAGVTHNSNIPIVTVPPHVLMTTDNHWYAGPGEKL